MCLCVNWSPGWTILLNCEVGEFQASVRYCYIRILRRLSLTNFIYPCPPHLYQSLSGSYYFLLLLPPPHKYISTKPHLYLCITRSPQPLLAWYVVHLYLSPILHLPVSYDCLCAPRREPASSAVSRVSLPLPFCPQPAPRSLLVPGGRPTLVPPSPFCPRLSHSTCASPPPVISWTLVSDQVEFFVCKC